MRCNLYIYLRCKVDPPNYGCTLGVPCNIPRVNGATDLVIVEGWCEPGSLLAPVAGLINPAVAGLGSFELGTATRGGIGIALQACFGNVTLETAELRRANAVPQVPTAPPYEPLPPPAAGDFARDAVRTANMTFGIAGPFFDAVPPCALGERCVVQLAGRRLSSRNLAFVGDCATEAPMATFETQRADFGARFSFGTPLHGAGKYPFCWASEVC